VRCREGKWLGEEADGAAGPFGGPETNDDAAVATGGDGVFSRVVEASCVVRGGRKASWAARAEKPPCAGARLLGRCGSEGDTRKKENPWWARMGRMAGWVEGYRLARREN
jgi:hypothetical protein